MELLILLMELLILLRPRLLKLLLLLLLKLHLLRLLLLLLLLLRLLLRLLLLRLMLLDSGMHLRPCDDAIRNISARITPGELRWRLRRWGAHSARCAGGITSGRGPARR